MKSMIKAITVFLFTGLTALGQVAVAEVSSIDGVWQLNQPVSRLVPVDGSDIPLTGEGRKVFEENQSLLNKGDYSFDPAHNNCGSPGQPKLMLTRDKFRVFARESMVTIIFEQNRLFRQISLDTSLENPVIGEYWWKFGTMQGRSFGEWQGQSLHIKTKGLSGNKLIDDVMPNSDQLEISEKWSLKDNDTLINDVTLSDPVMFTRPWTARLVYRRQDESAYPFKEQVCLDTL